MDANEGKVKFDEASRLFNEGRHAEALQMLGELDQAYPSNAKVMYPAALCLEKLGQTDKAVALCDKLIGQFQHQGAQELKNRLVAPAPAVPSLELGGIDDILGSEPSNIPPPVVHTSTNYKPLITVLVAIVAIGGLAAAAVFVLPLLGGPSGPSPEDVTRDFINAANAQDVEACLALMTAKARAVGGDLLKEQAKGQDKMADDFTIAEAVITDDNAKVPVQMTVQGESQKVTVIMRREEDNWRIYAMQAEFMPGMEITMDFEHPEKFMEEIMKAVGGSMQQMMQQGMQQGFGN